MKKRYLNILTIALLIISNIGLALYVYIKEYFVRINFIEVYYQLTQSLAGGGATTVVFDGVKTVYPVLITLTLIEVILLSKKIFITIKTKKKVIKLTPTKVSKYSLTFSIILFIITFIMLANITGLFTFVKTVFSTTKIYEEYYVDTNKVDITFSEEKNNLILIYLESMESSLFSKENGGAFDVSRIPELETLALENINFSSNDNLGGMYTLDVNSYTMSALISTTSATPILVQTTNTFKNKNKTLPKVRTLGDVLIREGYNLEMMQGSDIRFAGKDTYFKSHASYKIFDYHSAIERGYIDEDYYVWWGVEDAKLFEYAKNDLTILANKNEPFAFSLLTVDTHFKDGYTDQDCKKQFDDQLSNSYACSSKKVNDFINWIKLQDFYNNTTVVIIGDHIAMQNSYYNDYPLFERTFYNAFINSKVTTENMKNRCATSFDIYPTILASMGANIEGNRLGFGVNLFSGEKTIPEEIGLEKFNLETRKSSDYYRKNIY